MSSIEVRKLIDERTALNSTHFSIFIHSSEFCGKAVPFTQLGLAPAPVSPAGAILCTAGEG